MYGRVIYCRGDNIFLALFAFEGPAWGGGERLAPQSFKLCFTGEAQTPHFSPQELGVSHGGRAGGQGALLWACVTPPPRRKPGEAIVTCGRQIRAGGESSSPAARSPPKKLSSCLKITEVIGLGQSRFPTPHRQRLPHRCETNSLQGGDLNTPPQPHASRSAVP